LRQFIPKNLIVFIAEVLAEGFREIVHDQFISGIELGITLLGLVADGFNNFQVKRLVAGDKFPKPLPAEFEVFPLVFAGTFLPPIATAVDHFNRQRIGALQVYDAKVTSRLLSSELGGEVIGIIDPIPAFVPTAAF
jgi:hypothetical protein